jgi:cell division protein FtsW (lipid II flippase)
MRKEQEAYSKEVFMAFTSGYRMRIKLIIGICCFALLAVLIADETLPLKPIHDRVVGYNSTSYQSFTDGYVNEVSTGYGHHFFLANYTPTLFNEQSEITYYQTAISRSDVYVSHNGKSIEVHFTYYWARWFLYLLFVLGIIIPFYRKDTILLYLSTYMSLYVISGVVCSYVLLNYRILSIITLGNWP